TPKSSLSAACERLKTIVPKVVFINPCYPNPAQFCARPFSPDVRGPAANPAPRSAISTPGANPMGAATVQACGARVRRPLWDCHASCAPTTLRQDQQHAARPMAEKPSATPCGDNANARSAQLRIGIGEIVDFVTIWATRYCTCRDHADGCGREADIHH